MGQVWCCMHQGGVLLATGGEKSMCCDPHPACRHCPHRFLVSSHSCQFPWQRTDSVCQLTVGCHFGDDSVSSCILCISEFVLYFHNLSPVSHPCFPFTPIPFPSLSSVYTHHPISANINYTSSTLPSPVNSHISFLAPLLFCHASQSP